jgi:hypothetical protein
MFTTREAEGGAKAKAEVKGDAEGGARGKGETVRGKAVPPARTL